jgi:hypothetical protein
MRGGSKERITDKSRVVREKSRVREQKDLGRLVKKVQLQGALVHVGASSSERNEAYEGFSA